jgi:hypothetical protein
MPKGPHATLGPRGAPLAAELRTLIAGVAAQLAGTPAGTPDEQTGKTPRLVVYGTTVGAAPTTVNTGYGPPNGTGTWHSATMEGEFNLVDRTAGLTAGGELLISMRCNGGMTVPDAATAQDATTGDGALLTAGVTWSVYPLSTIEVVFNPPAGYAGTLDWVAYLQVVEN